MRQYQPEPRTYELMTILSPEVPDDDLQGQLDAIAGYVTGAGGEVVDVNRESPWGRRRLAYAIRHNGRDVRDGFYTLFHLRLDPAKVDEVEREIKLNDQIIRHLITHYEPKPVEAAEGEPVAEAQPAEAGAEAPATEAPPAEAAAPAAEARAPEAEAPAAEAVAQPTEAAPPPEQPEPAETAETAETTEPAAPATSEASDDQPQVATTAGTEEPAGASPTTTPGDEPENQPAQPDPTPKEE